MMDSAAMAAESDPESNRQFRRLWAPPPTRQRRRGQPPASDRNQETQPRPDYTAATAAGQRAIRAAIRRVAAIEIRAVLR